MQFNATWFDQVDIRFQISAKCSLRTKGCYLLCRLLLKERCILLFMPQSDCCSDSVHHRAFFPRVSRWPDPGHIYDRSCRPSFHHHPTWIFHSDPQCTGFHPESRTSKVPSIRPVRTSCHSPDWSRLERSSSFLGFPRVESWWGQKMWYHHHQISEDLPLFVLGALLHRFGGGLASVWTEY